MTRARFEPEAMSLSQEQRLGFLARSPLAGGFLARVKGRGEQLASSRHDWLEQRFGNVYGDVAQAAVADVASRHEASSAQVALSWVLHNPAVTAAVIGVQSVAQLSKHGAGDFAAAVRRGPRATRSGHGGGRNPRRAGAHATRRLNW